MLEPIIKIKDINLNFKSKVGMTHVLNGVNLEILPKQMVGLVGPSGSGKSSLLMLIGGMERSNSGTIQILQENISALSEKALTAFRRKHIGVIFQAFHLIQTMTALENVKITLEISGIQDSTRLSKEALEKVGLSNRMLHYPAQLSGGEQQRVAIARAVVKNPQIILADEPTGNLDKKAADIIKKLLLELKQEYGTTIIIATHSESLAKDCDRKFSLEYGFVTEKN